MYLNSLTSTLEVGIFTKSGTVSTIDTGTGYHCARPTCLITHR